ncbi:hypothetical protein GCM10020367_72220 [Streptomyces sannanensis]|uniref:LTD domain-containing protein n=1 Tax=Streptomyces sannanensis TaxID=285536 RepID=A0ABP6SPA9_9ACTN
MPVQKYGVLAARAVARRREGATDTPHYQIHLKDDSGTDYRAAVNVKSSSTQAPPDLLFAVVDDFRHPVTELLPQAGSGWHALSSQPGTGALDFIRGNLFDPSSMRILPPDKPGVDNDLADLLDHYVLRAIDEPTTGVFVFGARFGPEPGQPDEVFGFPVGNGVHDVHMNQGSTDKKFRKDNGVWQDGGLLLHLLPENRWVAVFLAFQSQKWHTDDVTGQPIDTAPPRPTDREEPLRIVAALVNPAGPAPEAETVTLLNASAAAIDLSGWHLSDQQKHRLRLPSQPLAAGATLAVTVADGFQLGNHGGAITLLNPSGLKIHGVSYTGRQASAEGRTITF